MYTAGCIPVQYVCIALTYIFLRSVLALDIQSVLSVSHAMCVLFKGVVYSKKNGSQFFLPLIGYDRHNELYCSVIVCIVV